MAKSAILFRCNYLGLTRNKSTIDLVAFVWAFFTPAWYFLDILPNGVPLMAADLAILAKNPFLANPPAAALAPATLPVAARAAPAAVLPADFSWSVIMLPPRLGDPLISPWTMLDMLLVSL